MGYTNSSLVNYTKLSPNHSGTRKHSIDTITIHCYVGQVTVESGGAHFANKSLKSSCNYLIGYDGKIALIVEEKNRSWCSSSQSNDNRAVTIEVASDVVHPYAITDKAYKSLIKLCADICKRNNIKMLLWKNDKSLIGEVSKQNLTVHRWFANKACPGDYLYNKLTQIVAEVNAQLGVTGWWVQDSSGWWYRNSDGTYPKKCWKQIRGCWYYFNERGYALTSQWLLYKGLWYYFNKDSKLCTGWNNINGYWYYMRTDDNDNTIGSCMTGWLNVDNQVYYMYPEKTGDNPQCSMALGLVNIDNNLYYFNETFNCQSVGSLLKNHCVIYNGHKYITDENGKCLNYE